MYTPPNQPNPYAPQQFQPPQYQPQPQYAPHPQPHPAPYGAHPGMQPLQPSLNFDHVDSADAEGGKGPQLPTGTYWLRCIGFRQRVSTNPQRLGQTFFILEFVLVNSLDPRASIPPGGKFSHGINQSKAIAMARVVKTLIGVVVGRGANEVPGNWIGTLITQPDALMDCVVQIDISDAVTDQQNKYQKWTPVCLIPDEVLQQYLQSVNPQVRSACFPNGLRSERGAPAPITFFMGGGAPGTQPIQPQPPQQPQYGAYGMQPPSPMAPPQWQPPQQGR